MAWHDPLAVRITSSAKMDGEIELSTEQAFSLSYVSYQALGVNVVLLSTSWPLGFAAQEVPSSHPCVRACVGWW
jgi:hypothetical protein